MGFWTKTEDAIQLTTHTIESGVKNMAITVTMDTLVADVEFAIKKFEKFLIEQEKLIQDHLASSSFHQAQADLALKVKADASKVLIGLTQSLPVTVATAVDRLGTGSTFISAVSAGVTTVTTELKDMQTTPTELPAPALVQ